MPVDRHLGGWNPQHGNLRAVAHAGEHFAEGCRGTRHFETHVESLLHAKLLLHLFERRLSWVHRHRDSHLFRERQAIRIQIADDHMARSGMAYNWRLHQTNRARSGDQDILAQNRKRQCRVYRVAKRIKDRGNLRIDLGIMSPDVAHREHDEFLEASRPIDPDSFCVCTQMPAAGEAIAAAPAGYMPFSADQLPDALIGNIRPNSNDSPNKFVPTA